MCQSSRQVASIQPSPGKPAIESVIVLGEDFFRGLLEPVNFARLRTPEFLGMFDALRIQFLVAHRVPVVPFAKLTAGVE